MAKLDAKELRMMDGKERKKKLEDLRMELLKSRSVKSGSIKTRQIKRMIARILTINKSLNGGVDNQ